MSAVCGAPRILPLCRALLGGVAVFCRKSGDARDPQPPRPSAHLSLGHFSLALAASEPNLSQFVAHLRACANLWLTRACNEF